MSSSIACAGSGTSASGRSPARAPRVRSRSGCSRGSARPGLLGLVERLRPDVVVSVYPQTTEVLARLRRSGGSSVPVLAGITDVAAMDYWACSGADAYLVTQPEAIDEVREIAGADADGAHGDRIHRPRSSTRRGRKLTRGRRSASPRTGTIVLVSGGGWGVGDITGAVAESLGIPGDERRLPDRSQRRAPHEELARRFAGEPRVRVEGFTEVMARLARSRRRARALDRRSDGARGAAARLPRRLVRLGARPHPQARRRVSPLRARGRRRLAARAARRARAARSPAAARRLSGFDDLRSRCVVRARGR